MTFGTLTNAFIGLTLTFAAMALLVSTVTEGVSSTLKWRSATLLDGLKSLLNVETTQRFWGLVPPARLLPDAVVKAGSLPMRAGGAIRAMLDARAAAAAQPAPAAGDPPPPPAPATTPAVTAGQLLCSLLNHCAINPRLPGDDASASARNAPSYIDQASFAQAFIDVLHDAVPASAATASLSAGIDNIADEQLRRMLTGLYRRTGEDLDKFKAELGTWFDAAMDRVGGTYKRYMQFWNFLIGLVLAIVFNVNAVFIVQALLHNPALVASIDLSTVTSDSAPALKALSQDGFPIGWPLPPCPDSGDLWIQLRYYLSLFGGWAITAVAALFGAPFWFDTLQRFVQLRGTGDKPGSKPAAKPAAAAT